LGGGTCTHLEKHSALKAVTLLEHLQRQYPDQYSDSIRRTLERRVKRWRETYGPEKEVIFRQRHEPGLMWISDFTEIKDSSFIIIENRLKPNTVTAFYPVSDGLWMLSAAAAHRHQAQNKFTAAPVAIQNGIRVHAAIAVALDVRIMNRPNGWIANGKSCCRWITFWSPSPSRQSYGN